MNCYVGMFRRCEAFYIRTHLEKYGLLPLEGQIIGVLRKGTLSQEELGARLNVDKGRIARAISLLEEKCFILRETNELNRRQKLVSLTPDGEEMLHKIDEIFRAWDEICYSGFTEEEKQLQQSYFKRIAENAIEYRRRNGVEKND